MRELIKCYHVFMPRIWEKLLLYLIYPVVLIGFGWMLSGFLEPFGVVFVCELIVPIELILDSLIFGGISSKDTNKLEYLKTSVKGMSVLKKSIIVDAVRRALTVTVILAAVYAKNSSGLSLTQFVMCTMTSFFLIELALLMTRYLSGMMILITVLSVMEPINLCVFSEFCIREIPVWVICPTAALCILVASAGRIIIMKKARGSYYDSRD